MTASFYPWVQEVIEMTGKLIPRDVRADASSALVYLNAGLQNATARMQLWLRRV